MEHELIDKIFENGQISDKLGEIIDGEVLSINQKDETKKLLASKIEEDIQQYLPDIGAIWGDERVEVKIKDDVAYAVWRDHWMPTIDFYQLVYKNSGIVEPKDFEGYGEIEKTAEE